MALRRKDGRGVRLKGTSKEETAVVQQEMMKARCMAEVRGRIQEVKFSKPGLSR